MSTDLEETQRQSAWQAFACSLGYTEPVAIRQNVLLGLAASAAVTILLLASGLNTEMAVFWTFGLMFGFVLQRSRFCFASAFRDIFLLRHGRSMKGVLVGLTVAIPAFAILMSKQVANPALGILPPDANVLPLGVHTVVGGLLFGAGMVIADGCVSGSIYRMGEGYIASWISFGGIMVGLLIAAFTWNWWWNFSIGDGARLWLPAFLGYGGALAVTLSGVLAVYLLILWWESRGGLLIPDMPFVPEEGDTFAVKLGNSLRRFFRSGWSILVGGSVLGGLNALLFYYAHPWFVLSELLGYPNVRNYDGSWEEYGNREDIPVQS